MTSQHLHRLQLIALLICFLLVSGAGLLLIVGTASAQENGTDTPTSTSTDTPEETENSTESDTDGTDTTETEAEQTPENSPTDSNDDEDTEDDDDDAFEYVFPGDNLRIVDSHWEGKTFVATFEAVNRPERITVTDGGREADDNENIEVDRQSYTISTAGTTEIRFTVVEDRQVTIDDGDTLLLKGHSTDISSPDVHTIVSAAIGLMMAFLLIIEIARRAGKLSKRRIEKA
jgi:cytoskeletal protein RodZ